MGGGLLQLVAIGSQDVFLTGNPQITFFKVVYKRHTNFSKECIEEHMNNVPTNNNSCVNEITLSRKGDLIQEMYVKLNVKTLSNLGSLIYDITMGFEIIMGDLEYWLRIMKPTPYLRINVGDKFYIDSDFMFSSNIILKAKDNSDNSILYEVTNKSNQFRDIFKVKSLSSDFTILPVSTYYTVDPNTPTNSHIIALNEQELKIQAFQTKIHASRDITNIIKSASISIGGQLIDKHYNKWLDIYNQLFEDNIDYVNTMCMTDIEPGTISIKYIPLRFWFNRNAGLALPLIALQYHDVKINIEYNSLIETRISYIKILNSSLLVNYIYLDTNERRKFAQTTHEYLIEQVQYTGEETLSPIGYIKMNFNHPIKALFWTTEDKHRIDNININLNGNDRMSKKNKDYFGLVQPYENNLGNSKYLDVDVRKWFNIRDYFSQLPDSYTVGMYSFCLNPKEHQPSGSCNFSRIDDARLYYESYFSRSSNGIVHLFALNYNVLRIMSGMGGLTYSN